MNVRPAGCLLSTLSLLALPVIGVMLLGAGFNDSGDNEASLNSLVYDLGLAAALLIFGLFWAWWRVPPVNEQAPYRSMKLSTAAVLCGAVILVALLHLLR